MDVLEENPREESDPDLEVKWDIRILEDRYNHWKDIVEDNIYQVHSAKHFTGFSRILQETRAHENQTKQRESKKT